MDLDMDSNLSTPYVSAPSSPSRGSRFGGLPVVPFEWEIAPGVPKGMEADTDAGDFKFKISQRHECCNEQPQQKANGNDLPVMSFADELFRNGRLRALMPPPRLRYVRNRCPTFGGPSFKNREFDPFAKALEIIRKEDTRVDHETSHRQTRSLSPLRSIQQAPRPTNGVLHHEHEMGPLQPTWKAASVSNCTTETTKSDPVGQMKHLPLVPIETCKPTKPSPAGQMRELMALRMPKKHRTGPIKKVNRRWAALIRWSKAKMIKDYLFRNALERKDKPTNKIASKRSDDNVRSFNSRSAHETHHKEKEATSRKIIVPYKPNGLLVCLGLGSKVRKYK